jgi:hypothetical protein
VGPTGYVFPVHKGNGNAGATSAAGTTNAVQVGLLVFWHGVVDYVGYFVNIDASGGNLGGNQIE